MKLILAQLRVAHWLKNALVLAPLFFSFSFTLTALGHSLLALISFCAMASAVYVVNDLVDEARDKIHPIKKNRPLASGRVRRQQAEALAVALVAIGGMPLIFLPIGVAYALGIYLLLNIAYSLGLKTVAIIDVMIVAFGFVLRVAVGGYAISVHISHWIALCTFFLALFLAFGKRKHEMTVLSLDDRVKHRASSGEYTEAFIDQVLVITAGIALVVYVLYTIDSDTVARFGGDQLVYTTPLVVYVLFRYLFLLYNKGKGGDPVLIFATDLPIIFSVVIWIVSLVSIYLLHFA